MIAALCISQQPSIFQISTFCNYYSKWSNITLNISLTHNHTNPNQSKKSSIDSKNFTKFKISPEINYVPSSTIRNPESEAIITQISLKANPPTRTYSNNYKKHKEQPLSKPPKAASGEERPMTTSTIVVLKISELPMLN